ncbi:MAG: hypothetical protein EPO08_00110 [Rhodospirillaceae bacterium]|nr:MAG: hypothetical protein EPO08_00110 [Rhodospirillaceae bacterium]
MLKGPSFWRDVGIAAGVTALLFAIITLPQIYLQRQRQRIAANPSPGFLVVDRQSLPPGLTETIHSYNPHLYDIAFAKEENGKRTYLRVEEDDTAVIAMPKDASVREFVFRDQTAKVFTFQDVTTGRITFDLFWGAKGKQRVSITLTQTPGGDYSPDDLVKILNAMKDS